MQTKNNSSSGNDAIPGREMFWRIGWIGIRLVLVYMLIDEFQPFFYQAF